MTNEESNKLLKKWADEQGKEYISNEEFFSSNRKGCFYQGMEKDADGEWVPDANTRAMNEEHASRQYPCINCGSTDSRKCCDGRGDY